MYDGKGQPLNFFSEKLDTAFLEQVKRDGQVSIIQELDILALLVAIELWCPEGNGHKVVISTDGEAVRMRFLKTWSKNDPSDPSLHFGRESPLSSVD